jgi:hypothetical protein
MKKDDKSTKKLNEYRLSRPSDISGNTKLSGNDLRSLMTNIKRRVVKGEKRKKIVKDELVKFWKNKGVSHRERILKGLKETDGGLLKETLHEVDRQIKQEEWWKYPEDAVLEAVYWPHGDIIQESGDSGSYWKIAQAHLCEKYPKPSKIKKKQ